MLIENGPFAGLQKNYYGALLADPPWGFQTWSGPEKKVASRGTVAPYQTMNVEDICALAVSDLCAEDCALFLWVTWPILYDGIHVLEAWGFKYKTCGFCWTKAHAGQLEMFHDDVEAYMGLGYWTRANTEPCLLATRGNPKRINADVRQAIVAPKRQHSRKPDGIHERIERLVAGPYLELFARQRRPGWDCWGNEVDKFAPQVSRETPPDSWANMWAKPFDFSKEPKGNPG